MAGVRGNVMVSSGEMMGWRCENETNDEDAEKRLLDFRGSCLYHVDVQTGARDGLLGGHVRTSILLVVKCSSYY